MAGTSSEFGGGVVAPPLGSSSSAGTKLSMTSWSSGVQPVNVSMEVRLVVTGPGPGVGAVVGVGSGCVACGAGVNVAVGSGAVVAVGSAVGVKVGVAVAVAVAVGVSVGVSDGVGEGELKVNTAEACSGTGTMPGQELATVTVTWSPGEPNAMKLPDRLPVREIEALPVALLPFGPLPETVGAAGEPLPQVQLLPLSDPLTSGAGPEFGLSETAGASAAARPVCDARMPSMSNKRRGSPARRRQVDVPATQASFNQGQCCTSLKVPLRILAGARDVRPAGRDIMPLFVQPGLLANVLPFPNCVSPG